MFGDNGQLPPTADTPLFARYEGSDPLKVEGRNAYRSFKHVICLTQQMRSAEDAQHRAAMDRLHDAKTTFDDWTEMKKRSLNASNANITKDEQRLFMDSALWLYSTNAKANDHNDVRLRALGKPVAYFQAISTGPRASVRDHPWKGGGMHRDLYLAEGARVMLRRNMWLSRGLVNGSLGNVHRIIFNADDAEPGNGCFPRGVICTFDAYTGPPYLPDVPKSVFVPVVTALYDENGVRSVAQRRCSVVAVLTAHLEAGTRASKSR